MPTSFITYIFDQLRPVYKAIKGKFVLLKENLNTIKVAKYNFIIKWRKVRKYFTIRVYLYANRLLDLLLNKPVKKRLRY